MKIFVYSLKNVLFQGAGSSLNCKTTSGEITVLDHHDALITALAEGTMKIVDENKKEHFFPVKDGFLEVKPGNEVRCIVEQ